jgi:hypothetical protein
LDFSEDWLRAFISSETGEFHDVRLKIAETLRARHVKPIHWEMLEKPSSLNPREFYLQYLETCQLYIGILGEKDSPGTEEEYREAVTIGLTRWIFIKQAESRGSQIQHLIELAEKEVVREKFTGDEDLRDRVDQRIQNYLSQTTREYLELRKRRTYEFLQDYRSKLLEPLLEQVQLVRNQLTGKQDIRYSDYWTPNKTMTHPYFDVDRTLKVALENFFKAYTKCELCTADATRDHETNCKALTRLHLEEYVRGMQPDARGRVYEMANSLLYQSSLTPYADSSQLSEERLSNIVEQANARLVQVFPDSTVLITENMNRSLREMVKGVIERDTKSQSIRIYLAARTELEAAANKAHELLWNRFVESTGYQPIP